MYASIALFVDRESFGAIVHADGLGSLGGIITLGSFGSRWTACRNVAHRSLPVVEARLSRLACNTAIRAVGAVDVCDTRHQPRLQIGDPLCALFNAYRGVTVQLHPGGEVARYVNDRCFAHCYGLCVPLILFGVNRLAEE